MKARIFNLIILDESGSMWGIKKEAIDNVNETIQTIRAAEKKHPGQEHFVTLVTFHDEVKTIYTCLPAKEVKRMRYADYQPQSCTALYDAMGFSLNELHKHVAPVDKVLVTIVTDGYENASREFNGHSIRALVNKLKAKGWVFAYIGANHDVEEVAATISISNVISFEATSEGTKAMSQRVNRSRERLYDDMSSHKFNAENANKNFFHEKKKKHQ